MACRTCPQTKKGDVLRTNKALSAEFNQDNTEIFRNNLILPGDIVEGFKIALNASNLFFKVGSIIINEYKNKIINEKNIINLIVDFEIDNFAKLFLIFSIILYFKKIKIINAKTKVTKCAELVESPPKKIMHKPNLIKLILFKNLDSNKGKYKITLE